MGRRSDLHIVSERIVTHHKFFLIWTCQTEEQERLRAGPAKPPWWSHLTGPNGPEWLSGKVPEPPSEEPKRGVKTGDAVMEVLCKMFPDWKMRLPEFSCQQEVKNSWHDVKTS